MVIFLELLYINPSITLSVIDIIPFDISTSGQTESIQNQNDLLKVRKENWI